MFVYDPATNTVEERGEIVPGLGGEVRPPATGPDGRVNGTGTRYNKVGLYIYDPKLGKVVKDFGAVGPSHPNGAWSRYVMGVDDTHAYIASGMLPAWYLVAIHLASGQEKVLLESATERVMDIIESFPGAYAHLWTYHQVSAAHVRTFGLCFPDVDRDGDRLVEDQMHKAAAAPLRGAFESRGLKCGIYTLQAGTIAPSQAPQTTQRQIILTPNPWEE